MMQTFRARQLLAYCAAAGVTAAAGLFGAVAAAEPVVPPPTPGHVSAPPTLVDPTVSPRTPSASDPPAVPAAAPVPTAVPGSTGGAAGTSPPSTLVPAGSGTLRDYFAEQGVSMEPQQPAGFTPLDITLPVPYGWTQVPDPNVPDAFAVIANRRSGALYTPNAQLVVYRLVGHFDPTEAITHGYVDSQQLPAWRATNASLADFGGFPSSMIEGTYRQNDMTLNTSQRHIIAAAGANSYLVSMAVTTGVGESVASAPATDAIINGFRVSAPGAAALRPSPLPTPPLPPRSTLPTSPRG